MAKRSRNEEPSTANPKSAKTPVPARDGAETLLHVETPLPYQRLAADRPVTVTGWFMSPDELCEIVATCGSRAKAARHGLYRPDLARLFPQHAQMFHVGFECHLDSIAACNGETMLTVTAHGKTGSLHKVDVPLFFDQTRDGTIQSLSPAHKPNIIAILDEPVVADGVVAKPLQAGLAIAGWAISRAGIDRITIELDGVKIGDAYYGMRREDVAAIYLDWPDALLSGFAFSLNRRGLRKGDHKVNIRIAGKDGEDENLRFTFLIEDDGKEEGPWTLRRKMPAAERLLVESMIGGLSKPPHFLICLNYKDKRLAALRETLRSLAAQIYQDWAVVLSGVAREPAISEMIQTEFSSIRKRVKIDEDTRDKKQKPRTWVLRADAGDIFAINALCEFTFAIEMNPQCDLIYADDRRFNPASGAIEAFFKPDSSPHLLMSMNYIGRPWAIPLSQTEKIGLQVHDLIANGDYDLLLQCSEKAKHIVHVSQVLCERGEDTFDGKLDLKALARMAKRRKLKVAVEPGRVEGSYRLRSKMKTEALVSIIIPTCGTRDLIKTCLDGLKTKSTYQNIEIIIIDTISDQTHPLKNWLRENADVVIEVEEPFNWSRFNNLATKEASGSYLLFLNDDIEIIQSDWLEAMLEEAISPEVGVVGPQLLYPDGKVQHAGFFLADHMRARHAFRFCAADDPGYFGLGQTRRDVIGVTGACMLMRRDVFDALGGFDEAHAVVNNDLDFCLKAHAKGLWNIYTPHAQLVHHELASRAEIRDVHNEVLFKERYASLFDLGDPFFHHYLARAHDIYQYDAEPDTLVFPGHPYYVKQDVARILAIKVDHIGDFITALPAFRRIKTHFPKASLSVLVAPASEHFARLESAIDDVIVFEFFHARSALGQMPIGDEALKALKAQLAPRDFDLAIDFRKHPETRQLLQLTNAKVLAGFASNQAFPWLDIARSCETDERFAAKQTHITDDLLGLVDQVALAGDVERGGFCMADDFEIKKQALLSKFANDSLYARPLVCIHPASGSEMRQWPPAFFASLADRLIEQDNVNIAVIGSHDENDIADLMLASAKHKDRIFSLIGSLPLSELPYFLSSCALFVGNNSGPQHLAASLGVPTVGIHSGVVDPAEWGPLGDKAVAVKREMTCAPCYLAKREDCHRGLECLTGLSPATVLSACQRFLRLCHV